MPDFCDLPGCTNIASQRCSKCKITYYCSKEHQRAAWKEHKVMCNEVESTKAEDIVTPNKQANAGAMAMIEPVVQMMESMFPNRGSCIPGYPNEYKKRYPADKDGYQILQTEYTSKKSLFLMEKTSFAKPICLLHQFGNIQKILIKRWQCFAPFLVERICRLKIGEIWKGHGHLKTSQVYGKDDWTGYQRYQTMRNTASPKITLERGKSYVSVGFVDLQQVMEAEILDSDIDAAVAWIGFEMNEMAVARSMIVLDLIQHDAPACAILQIWYSSCISNEASAALIESCQRLEGIEKDEKLKRLFHCWGGVSLGVKEATARWRQYISSSQMAVLSRLRHEEDRVFFARYLLTGQFLLPSSLTNQGNTTWFCLPKRQYLHYKKADENIFFSFDVTALEYKGDLKSSVEMRFTDLMEKMIQNIKEKRLTIEVKTEYFDRSLKEEVFQEIKSLQPCMMDWSNIPDYLTFCDFFYIAQKCSGPDTIHTFHLMNWPTKVFGCNIVDYVDIEENYKAPNFSLQNDFRDRSGKLDKLMKQLEKDFTLLMAKNGVPSFLKLDMSTFNPMDISEVVLYERYLDTFVEFMFDGRNVKGLKWKKRPFTMVERANSTADVSFSFNL